MGHSNLFALLLIVLFLCSCFASFAEDAYRLPPPRIAEIVNTPPTPRLLPNPRGGSCLLVEYEMLTDIETLAKPILRLAGMRIWPDLSCKQQIAFVHRISVRSSDGKRSHDLQLPRGARTTLPKWSPDGKKIALPLFEKNRIEVWVFDAATGRGHRIAEQVNTILLPFASWTPDSRALLVPLVPMDRGEAPGESPVPNGPNTEESSGKVSKLRTYQDLLKTAFDDASFEHFAATQLARVETDTCKRQLIGGPGLYQRVEYSPSGACLLVRRLKKPFSHIVPAELFAHTIEIWDANGKPLHTLADLPAAEELPIEGVPTGPRRVDWQPLLPDTLTWTEALDGGDPTREVPFREQIKTLAAPFTGQPRDLFRIPQRLERVAWLQKPGLALITDYDRDRKWTKTRLFDTLNPGPAEKAKVIFDLSEDEVYNDPGQVVFTTLPDGQNVGILDGERIYLQGQGGSPEGFRPFLHRLSLKTGATEILFRCASGTFEEFVEFTDDSRRTLITSFESPTESPNYFLRSLRRGKVQERRPLTAFPDPAPELSSIKQELLSYTRDDGIPLSGKLYFPVGYEPGKKYPVVMTAYPMKYLSAATAGQVRVSTTQYIRPEASSFKFFLLHGYAVLEDAEIPIVGDPKTANDTFVAQITAGAKAAVDALTRRGILEPGKIGVCGHSYGANMVAHLLAHTDLFAAGIARSGAYNRTLTPFGFQDERRTFWEVPEIYLNLSPFTHAHKIKEPLLLTHGEADNNAGTFPMQSERLMAALRGTGGKARLVKLPYESHGYRARESVLHVLAEMFDWFDAHVKNKR